MVRSFIWLFGFFFSSRRRHTRWTGDWSSDVCSSDLIRFLFGSGEAGALPNVARTFSRWFPRQERGTAQGIFFMAMHLAGGLTPMLVTALLAYFNWRSLFALFGSLGFVWSWAWYRWFRDSPAEHPGVGAAERRLIERGLAADAGHAR